MHRNRQLNRFRIAKISQKYKQFSTFNCIYVLFVITFTFREFLFEIETVMLVGTSIRFWSIKIIGGQRDDAGTVQREPSFNCRATNHPRRDTRVKIIREL